MPQQQRMIGLFGGTFDPVHYGHLRAAVEVREALQPDDFRLMPAGTPPHRSHTFASAGDRLAMLKLALPDSPEYAVDDREVKREGFSYMVDTLSEIHREEPKACLLLMIGQDAANTLDSWHEWRRLFELAHLVIMRRPNSKHHYSTSLHEELKPRLIDQAADLRKDSAGLVLPVELTQLAISSTDIRRRIGLGLSPRYLLPDPVIGYIRKHILYRKSS
jgi:nicotinate-nucleotide adenylyltransferase